jgi:hypothetical protein
MNSNQSENSDPNPHQSKSRIRIRIKVNTGIRIRSKVIWTFTSTLHIMTTVLRQLIRFHSYLELEKSIIVNWVTFRDPVPLKRRKFIPNIRRKFTGRNWPNANLMNRIRKSGPRPGLCIQSTFCLPEPTSPSHHCCGTVMIYCGSGS